MRLVLVSFAVLALVFYEMSGGSDFQPPDRPQIAETANAAATDKAPRRVDIVADKPVRVAPATLVSKSAIVPAVAKEPETAKAEPRAPSAELQQVRASLSQGLTLVSNGAQASDLSLVSLELGAAGLSRANSATESDAATETARQIDGFAPQDADLREIIGTRVNMRDGPGTIYPVVARLNIGQSVEVLSESGTGWLRLRTVPGQQLGWISASLVSKAGR
ncbi:SH3 domain-containing protein [Sedimentitalea todarodis]|uniref:SH3 domain-containing protein n=1 Tax=Sedimentitalea todarodis TaxID=1631240 RepID=A0ABU3VGC4_9RHOB|nr:SH3 domain-containing protein [Sedimentitalea todarodis]MDU9005035.1 SH3 domain-containing protein [Sedimentitalea todarodis]